MSFTANNYQDLTTKLANFVRSSELSEIIRDEEIAEQEALIMMIKPKSPSVQYPNRTHEITFHIANREFDEPLVESLSKLGVDEARCICDNNDYCD